MYGHGDGDASNHLTLFNSHRPTNITFNALAYYRHHHQRKRAMRVLSGRHRLLIDDEHRIDPTDPNIVVATGPHFLDFVMYIGGRRGLDAMLPNTQVDQAWSFQLDFSSVYRLWPKGKSSTLPFNPQGRLMYIGRVYQEQVWIVMAPNEWLEENHNFNASGHWPILPSKTTAMDGKHALMVIMFIGKMLADRRVQDFHCDPEYPAELTREAVNDATEIL